MRGLAVICLLVAIAGEARAQDTWSDPFPGVLGVRRGVGEGAVAAWGLEEAVAAAREMSAEEMSALPEGAPVLGVAYALKGSGPAVYVVDVADPTDPEAEVPDGLEDEGGELVGGCAAAGGRAGGLVIVLVMVLVLVRVRRRRRG